MQNNFKENGYKICDFKFDLDTIQDINERIKQIPYPDVESCNGIIYDLIRFDKEWLTYGQHPKLIKEICEALNCNKPINWSTALFYKNKTNPKGAPFHQDVNYWPITNGNTISAWISLNDSNENNGCLMVIPKTHKSKNLYKCNIYDKHAVNFLKNSIDINDQTFEKLVPVILKKGQISLHDPYIIHGSLSTINNKRRAALVIRYMDNNAIFDKKLADLQAKNLGNPSISNLKIFDV